MYKKRLMLDSSSVISSKKGQITIFIIIGLVLLLLLSLVIVFTQEAVTFKPKEVIPTEPGQVASFVRSCLFQTGGEGLEIMGLQGGYIDVPNSISSDDGLRLEVSPVHTVPYWAYGPQTNIQSLQQMELRLDEYIKQNIRTCVFDLGAFEERFDIIERSDIEVSTKILENKVVFDIEWDLDVQTKAGDLVSSLKDFSAESDVKLFALHNTAVRIIEKEILELKLEDLTQDLISLEHPNVPVAGMDLSCQRKEWDVTKVQSTLKDMLRINLRQLKIAGTEFVEFPEELPYYQNHYIWNLGDDFKQKDVGAVFNFDNNYPFTFQVTPVEGTKLKSSSTSQTHELLSFLCIQNWKFTYDVSYPILVRLVDETTGYNFNIAFTVHLVRNMPNRDAEIIARPSSSLVSGNSEQYCSNRRIPMTVSTREHVQNDKQGIDFTDPLSGVDITYTCLKYRCEMGTSEFNYAQSGYQSSLNINFPYCVGGIMRGKKEGYKEDNQRVTVESGKEVTLNLVPLLQYPVSQLKVVKHSFEGTEQEAGDAKPLGDDETALIKLTMYKDNKKFHEISQAIGSAVEVAPNQELNLDLLGKADFEYELEVNVFDDDTIIGGYKTNWTIPSLDIENSNQIVFHVLETNSKDQIYDLISNLEEYSGKVPRPEITNEE